MTDLTHRTLAECVSQTRFSNLPAATIEKAKLHILDTIGASLAGSLSEETSLATTALGFRDGAGDAPVWGTSLRVFPKDAAFLNGVSAHALELDDCGGCDHSGAVVLPAALAALSLSASPIHGSHLLLSVIMGYEVGRRILEACGGYEVHNGLGWHSTGTCGVFGAATSAGMVMGLGQAQLDSALGIACSYAGGTWAFIHDGSQTKKLHSGRAAEGGVAAASLAAASFKGPASALSADIWGSYLSAFGRDKGDDKLLTLEFGERWRLDRCSIKPYATCRGTHSAIDAIEALLVECSLSPSDIVNIDVAMSRFQADMCGGKSIGTRAEAQMSLPYALSARLEYGKVFLDELEEGARASPDIEKRMQTVNIFIEDRMRDEEEPVVTIKANDGRSATKTVLEPLGSPNAPLSQVRVEQKFTDLASRALPANQVAQIADYVLSIESRADVRDFPGKLLRAS